MARKPMTMRCALQQFNFSIDFGDVRKILHESADIYLTKDGVITDDSDIDKIQYIVRNHQDPEHVEIYYVINFIKGKVVKSHNCQRNPNTKTILKHMNDMTQQIAQ